MKYLKKFENNFNFDDFDEEEFEYGIKWDYGATLDTFIYFMKDKDIINYISKNDLDDKVIVSEVVRKFFDDKVKKVDRIKEYYLIKLEQRNENFDWNEDDFDDEEFEYGGDSELTDKQFVNFLQDNDIYDRFIYNFNPHDSEINNLSNHYSLKELPIFKFCDKVMNLYGKQDFLWAAFNFKNTPEGLVFWSKYDRMWSKVLLNEINKSNESFDFEEEDFDFEEEDNGDVVDALFNYKWIKVYKDNWNDFVSFLKDNNVTHWANFTTITNQSFDLCLDGLIKQEIGDYDDDEDEDEWTKEYNEMYDQVKYVYIKLYQNEYGKISGNEKIITYYFGEFEINKYINLGDVDSVVFKINENFDFDEEDFDFEEEQPNDQEYIDRLVDKKITVSFNKNNVNELIEFLKQNNIVWKDSGPKYDVWFFMSIGGPDMDNANRPILFKKYSEYTKTTSGLPFIIPGNVNIIWSDIDEKTITVEQLLNKEINN